MTFVSGLTPVGPVTGKQPVMIPIHNWCGEVIYICWYCAYGECEHCHNYNRCQHTHWWGNPVVSKTQAITARDASSGVREDGKQVA